MDRRNRMMNRRQVLVGLSLVATGPARAQQDFYPLRSDSGQPIANGMVPADLDPSDLAGVIWVGGASPDVFLIEFFDYNCPWCRGAVHTLDDLVSRDPNLKLGIVNNAILSPASVEAAKVQQAVLRANGPDVAYRFHKQLLSIHGIADRSSALSVAQDLGLNMDMVRSGVDLERVALVLKRQMKRAESLSFSTTPSFVIDGVTVRGWPGPKSIASMIQSVRSCDKPMCSAG
jgi:protein-disulfide isomerase